MLDLSARSPRFLDQYANFGLLAYLFSSYRISGSADEGNDTNYQRTLIGIWVIIAVSILIERSPMALITGLGAFAAVLMLIFKDSILGFVAGVQLSQNDMIRNGDWIVVPGGA